MILIISNEMDVSTDEVCQWLYHKNANYFRVNSQDRIVIEDIKINANEEIDFTLDVLGKGKIKFSEISAYWYRRGQIKIKTPKELTDTEFTNILNWYKTEVQFVKKPIKGNY